MTLVAFHPKLTFASTSRNLSTLGWLVKCHRLRYFEVLASVQAAATRWVDESQLENEKVPGIHRNTEPARSAVAPRRIIRLSSDSPVTSSELTGGQIHL